MWTNPQQTLLKKFLIENLIFCNTSRNIFENMEIYWQTIERKDTVVINLIALLNFHVGILTVFLVRFFPGASLWEDFSVQKHLQSWFP